MKIVYYIILYKTCIAIKIDDQKGCALLHYHIYDLREISEKGEESKI